MFKKATCLVILILSITVFGFSQTTINPTVGFTNVPNAKITKIDITYYETDVTVEYTKTEPDEKQAWVRFSSSMFIKPRGGTVQFHIQNLGSGKRLDEKYSVRDSIGTVYTFVMIFPPIDAGIESVDLIEPTSDGWRWENIAINNPKEQASPRPMTPSLATSASSQSVGQQVNGKAQSIDEMQSRAKKLKMNKSLNFEYDRFSNWSSVYTKPQNLVGGGEGFVAELAAGLARQNGNYDTDIVTDVYMTVLSGFSGSTLERTPDEYGVLFEIKATTWQFLGGDRTLYFIIDGSRRQYESTASQNQVGGNLSSGVRTNETIFYVIPRTDLVFIANGSTVELRLGNTKPRKLKKEALERIRNLLQITAID